MNCPVPNVSVTASVLMSAGERSVRLQAAARQRHLALMMGDGIRPLGEHQVRTAVDVVQEHHHAGIASGWIEHDALPCGEGAGQEACEVRGGGSAGAAAHRRRVYAGLTGAPS